MKFDDLARIRKKADKLQREADKAQGGLDRARKQLILDFDCSNLKKAVKLLENMDSELEELEESFGKSLEQFKKEWDEFLS